MRQVVTAKRQAKRRKIHFNTRSVMLSSLAGILFLFGLGVGFMQLHTNKEVKAQVKTLAAQTQSVEEGGDVPVESGLPSEERPTGSVGGYKAAPESPKIISIADLGVRARVLRMGVKPNNEIKTPNNIYDTGWFENSARPGELGAVFINAHVHGPSKPGVFAGLKKLKEGQKIKIERGDGKIFTYSVVKTEVYDKDKVDMGAALNSIVPGKPGLNLITCDGQYKADGGYSKRIVVFAVQD
jgi:LPXTG-site transpeptidase (sortase) family protein